MSWMYSYTGPALPPSHVPALPQLRRTCGARLISGQVLLRRMEMRSLSAEVVPKAQHAPPWQMSHHGLHVELNYSKRGCADCVRW